eukprot:Awhi_evm2s14800
MEEASVEHIIKVVYDGQPQTLHPKFNDYELHIIGLTPSGDKCRVETQKSLCLQLKKKKIKLDLQQTELMMGDYDQDFPLKEDGWLYLAIPDKMTGKRPLKNKNPDMQDNEILYLDACVTMASNPFYKATVCEGCIKRERKRLLRAKSNWHIKAEASPSAEEIEKILLFNVRPLVSFHTGDVILPTRITCYCRHHNESNGFK